MIPLSLIIFPILTVDLANVLLAVLFGSADAIVSFCGFLVAFTVGFGVTVGVLDVSAAGVTVGVTVGVGVGTISSPSDDTVPANSNLSNADNDMCITGRTPTSSFATLKPL